MYALHVHIWGDLTSSLGIKNISTGYDGVGSHFNPFNAPHGCDTPGTFTTKHVGDIGNYTTRANTQPFNLFSSSLIDLSYTNRSIIGRSVILHESYDHCVQPTGAAGTPISQQINRSASQSIHSTRGVPHSLTLVLLLIVSCHAIVQGVIGIANPWLNAWYSELDLPAPTNVTKNRAALPLASSAVTDPNVHYGITASQSAVAVLFPLGKDGVVQQPWGVVRFGPTADNKVGASISITIRYLEPNTTHGIHIHAYGDDFDGSFSPYTPTPGHYTGSDNFANSGSHFNPVRRTPHICTMSDGVAPPLTL